MPQDGKKQHSHTACMTLTCADISCLYAGSTFLNGFSSSCRYSACTMRTKYLCILPLPVCVQAVNAETAATALVDLALAHGSLDNVSVVVIDLRSLFSKNVDKDPREMQHNYADMVRFPFLNQM